MVNDGSGWLMMKYMHQKNFRLRRHRKPPLCCGGYLTHGRSNLFLNATADMLWHLMTVTKNEPFKHPKSYERPGENVHTAQCEVRFLLRRWESACGAQAQWTLPLDGLLHVLWTHEGVRCNTPPVTPRRWTNSGGQAAHDLKANGLEDNQYWISTLSTLVVSEFQI